MTSYGLIFKLSVGISILTFFTEIPGYVAIAAALSFVALDFMGMFKRDKEYLSAKLKGELSDDVDDEDDDGLTDRAREFRRKFEAAKEDAPQAIMNIDDPSGKQGQIIFRTNGEIDVTGTVDPNIIRAAEQLRESIKIFGVQPVLDEFKKQLDEYYAERDNSD